MKAIICDAFGTLFNVGGGSAKTIINNIAASGRRVDEKEFLEEWKSYYKENVIFLFHGFRCFMIDME